MKFILFLAFVVSISLISCQKDYTPEGVISDTIVPPPQIPGDSSYIDSVIEIFISPGSPNDTSYYVVNYDNRKRISDIKLYFDNKLGEGVFYFYHNNDTLPYLWTTLPDPNFGIDSVFTLYASDGRLVADSIKSSYDNVIVITKYTYTQNVITTYRRYTSPANPTFITKDTGVIDVNNNLLSNKSWDHSNPLPQLISTSSFTYDNKFSAFAGRNILPAESGIPGQFPIYELLDRLSYNNMLTQVSKDEASMNSDDFIYQNTYYPDDRIKSTKEATSNEITIRIFKYKNL